jgi:hypothetical protein
MGSKNRDTLQRREAARHCFDKKTAYERTLPYLLNLIDFSSHDLRKMNISFNNDVDVYVINLLNGSKNKYLTRILDLKPKANHEVIDSIKCPVCGKVLYLDKYWNCFICETKTKFGKVISASPHDRMIFDIMEINIPKIEELEDRANIIQAQITARMRRGHNQ